MEKETKQQPYLEVELEVIAFSKDDIITESPTEPGCTCHGIDEQEGGI